MKNVVLILILIGLFSCESNEKTTDIDKSLSEDSVVYEKVVVYNIRLHYSTNEIDTIISIDSFLVDTCNNNEENIICFKKNVEVDSVVYTPFYFIKEDKYWSLDTDNKLFPILNLDTFFLAFNNDQIEIVLSYFDLINANDEESYIYWNKDIGILGMENRIGDVVVLYDYKKYKGLSRELLLNKLIQRRKTQDSISYEEIKRNQKTLD